MTKKIIVSSDDKGLLLAVKSDKKEPSFFIKPQYKDCLDFE